MIGPAVVVVIAHRHAHAEIAARDAGFLRDIGEGAVAIVFIEGVADRLWWASRSRLGRY